jgi:FkbM family methyltransferase
VKDLLKRLLPAPLQRAIYRFIWNPFRDAYWRALKLGCTLPSGLNVEIRNRSDWTIYNEILVNGEYDVAIATALQRRQPGQPFTVADLGGNVGFFTFRCADRFFRQNTPDDSLRIFVVEGSPTVFRGLERRIAAQPLLRDRVKPRLGLVGQKEGEAYIGGHHIHYANMVSPRATPGATRIPFIDLDKEFAEIPRIDLLKCDIEGAEFEFIEKYEGFLGKVQTAVFEFHRYGRNIEESRRQLRDYGFRNRLDLREAASYSIELYWR